MASSPNLIERVESGQGADNELDVLIEIALFEPDGVDLAIRANSAGTKVIYTYPTGEETYWARDWTLNRLSAAAALRARAVRDHLRTKEQARPNKQGED